MGFALSRGRCGGGTAIATACVLGLRLGCSKTKERPEQGNVGDRGEKLGASKGAGVVLEGIEQTASLPCLEGRAGVVASFQGRAS
jgi:hypothetical protein